MKITKPMHHGKFRWRINNPCGPNGKRQRKFFETKAAAGRYAGTITPTARLTPFILSPFCQREGGFGLSIRMFAHAGLAVARRRGFH
jgi:hypothetical protein